MRINTGLTFFIIFVEFVSSDIGIGGHIPSDTQRLRHQTGGDSERVDTLCDDHSNGGCPCSVREVGQYIDKATEKYQPTLDNNIKFSHLIYFIARLKGLFGILLSIYCNEFIIEPTAYFAATSAKKV